MPIYYLVIAGAVVLLVLLFTCCCCKQTVIVDRVKDVEVPVSVPITVQEPIIIGRVNKAKILWDEGDIIQVQVQKSK